MYQIHAINSCYITIFGPACLFFDVMDLFNRNHGQALKKEWNFMETLSVTLTKL